MSQNRISPDFPVGRDAPAQSGGTPATTGELVMTDYTTRGGFRLLYPTTDKIARTRASIAYVIDHGSKGGYDFTVITAEEATRRGFNWFFSNVEPRTERLRLPDSLAEATWDAWVKSREPGVQHMLRSVTSTLAHHEEKNRFVIDGAPSHSVTNAESAGAPDGAEVPHA